MADSVSQHASNPFGFDKHAMAYRLLRDPAACSISVRVIDGEEHITCSQPMEDLFISSHELQTMCRQFGVLSGYLWTVFVVPEDRFRLMCALASATYERGSRIQLDTVVRCVSRKGDIIRCLASTGFHAEAEEGVTIILRLWPLAHRDLNVLVRGVGGGQGGREERLEIGGRGGGGEGGGWDAGGGIRPPPAQSGGDRAAWSDPLPISAALPVWSNPSPPLHRQQHQSGEEAAMTNPPPPHHHPHPHHQSRVAVTALGAGIGMGTSGGDAGDVPPLSSDMWHFVAEATASTSPMQFIVGQHQHGGSST